MFRRAGRKTSKRDHDYGEENRIEKIGDHKAILTGYPLNREKPTRSRHNLKQEKIRQEESTSNCAEMDTSFTHKPAEGDSSQTLKERRKVKEGKGYEPLTRLITLKDSRTNSLEKRCR